MARIKTLRAIVLGAAFLGCMPSISLATDEAEWQRLNSEAVAAYREGDYAKATRAAEEALSLARQLDGGFQRLATSLNNLALLYESQGQYAKAEPLNQRALAIREQALGSDHPDVALSLNNLAGLYRSQGLYAKATPLVQRALAIFEQALGPEHPDVARSLNNLAGLYKSQGQYAKGEPLYQRALAIHEQALGPDHTDVATSLNNLATLFSHQGRFGEAEPLYQRALAIDEQALGPENPRVAAKLNNLADLFESQGQYAKAEPLYQRALAIFEQALGPDHPRVAASLSNLAGLYKSQSQYAKAEPLNQRALAIFEQALGPDHPDVAESLNYLADLYESQGQYAKAQPLYQRALAINEQALGPEHPSVARSLNNLAVLHQNRGQYAKAEPLHQRALAINEQALGPDHPDVATSLNNLSGLYQARGDVKSALKSARRASAIMEKRFSEPSRGNTIGQRSEQRGSSFVFFSHLSLLKNNRHAHAQESLKLAQLGRVSDTAQQVARMSARQASGGGPLNALARQRQDLQAALTRLDSAMVEAAAKARPTERLREQHTELMNELRDVDERLDQDFPAYWAMVSPRPLASADLQVLLQDDEALVVHLLTQTETYLWVVRRNQTVFLPLKVSPDDVAKMVRALRVELDPISDSFDLNVPFDVELAYQLYEAIMAPAEPHLAGVDHLLVVPDGPLQSLPYGVLVTGKPASRDGNASLDDVSWLIKRYALSTLPSVSSMRALRGFGTPPVATQPFVGFGDPVLRGSQGSIRGVKVSSLFQRGLAVAGKASGLAVVARVRALEPLPETAKELQALASTLGAGNGNVFLREAATEGNVKSLDLRPYRTLAFATHGLMSGELKGVVEPALVLTPPNRATENDDGLLTASEVSQLKLSADAVLLSACNTAAPDGTPGAEGLSGLAKAFFYAGARSLLVSHWSVDSDATVSLTTGAYREQEAAPGIGRAEALRRAMKTLMGRPGFEHPTFWAPFVVVGEGGAEANP